jgi:hypothetical protein
MKCLIHLFLVLFLFWPTTLFAAEKAAKGSIESSQKPFPLTNEMLDESLQISADCKGYGYTNTHYDCDCVGMTFLELRRKKGMTESAFWLREEAQRKCPNEPAMAGKMYSECLGWAPLQRGEDYKEFCSCYGSKFAKLYGRNPSENLYVIEAQMTVAMSKCNANSINEQRHNRDSFIKKLKENGMFDKLFPGATSSN